MFRYAKNITFLNGNLIEPMNKHYIDNDGARMW